MAKRLSAAEREQKTAETYELSVKGWTNVEIAKELGINKNTVSSYLRTERQRRAGARGHSAEESIAVYEQIKRHAWQRLESVRDTSLSGLLNTIVSAQGKLDVILGVTPKDSGSAVNVNVNQYSFDLSRVPTDELKRVKQLIDRATVPPVL